MSTTKHFRWTLHSARNHDSMLDTVSVSGRCSLCSRCCRGWESVGPWCSKELQGLSSQLHLTALHPSLCSLNTFVLGFSSAPCSCFTVVVWTVFKRFPCLQMQLKQPHLSIRRASLSTQARWGSPVTCLAYRKIWNSLFICKNVWLLSFSLTY